MSETLIRAIGTDSTMLLVLLIFFIVYVLRAIHFLREATGLSYLTREAHIGCEVGNNARSIHRLRQEDWDTGERLTLLAKKLGYGWKDGKAGYKSIEEDE